MKQKASIYVPAIGKVTIVVLLRNLLVSLPRPGGSETDRLTLRQRLIENRQYNDTSVDKNVEAVLHGEGA